MSMRWALRERRRCSPPAEPVTRHRTRSAQEGTAIAVVLLACMLTRMWDGPKATAILVELVEKRKAQIAGLCDSSNLSHHALLAAAQQDITRRELAGWDQRPGLGQYRRLSRGEAAPTDREDPLGYLRAYRQQLRSVR